MIESAEDQKDPRSITVDVLVERTQRKWIKIREVSVERAGREAVKTAESSPWDEDPEFRVVEVR